MTIMKAKKEENKTLLIIDDEALFSESLNEILRDKYNVHTASSMKEGVKKCRDTRVDLILMDITMPEISGIEGCRRFKEIEDCKDIPIIMLTAEKSQEMLQSAFDAGAIDYIRKPLNNVELFVRLRSALRLKSEMDCRKRHEEELVRLNELKNRFLGIAAHDLRNPLHAIKLSSDLLLEGNIPGKKIKSIVEMINSATVRMMALVENLLDVSVIESGKLELQSKSASLGRLLKERTRLFSIIAERKHISIHSKLLNLPDFPFDSNRIAQVMDNLLSNAIKFSPVGSDIYVNLAQDGHCAEVSIKDEGPGIPPGEQNRLFVEFQRTCVQPTWGEKSTGLGLAIVKKIVDAHGGDVWVNSGPGSGTTFGFALPINKDLPKLSQPCKVATTALGGKIPSCA